MKAKDPERLKKLLPGDISFRDSGVGYPTNGGVNECIVHIIEAKGAHFVHNTRAKD